MTPQLVQPPPSDPPAPSVNESGGSQAQGDLAPVSVSSTTPLPKEGGSLLRSIYGVACGILFGFSILILGHKYFGAKILPAPVIPIDYRVIKNSPDSAKESLDLVTSMIRAAEHEILICARVVSLKKIAEALDAKITAGVEVRFLLDGETNPPGKGIRKWAEDRKLKISVSGAPLVEQFIVVDRKLVFKGAAAFSVDGFQAISAPLVVDSPSLGTKLKDFFINMEAKCKE